MAMTARLPSELDTRLEALARARHTSKHALLVEAVDRFVSAESKTERAVETAQGVADRYSTLLRRLEDA